MKITLDRVNDKYHFELKNERGHIVNVDNRACLLYTSDAADE